MINEIGKEVVLEGTAVDSKLGAVLLTRDGLVYIDGLESWPNGFYLGGDKGRRVRVKGTLIERADLPVITEDPGAPRRAGIPLPAGADPRKARTRRLVSKATWTLLD